MGHSASFKVIPIGVGRNPEGSAVIRYTNVDLISEIYEDIATGTLQRRRRQRPQSGLTTLQRKTTVTEFGVRQLSRFRQQSPNIY